MEAGRPGDSGGIEGGYHQAHWPQPGCGGRGGHGADDARHAGGTVRAGELFVFTGWVGIAQCLTSAERNVVKMRKLAYITAVAATLLSSCGGPSVVDPPPDKMGMITLSLRKGEVQPLSSSDATNIRILVSNRNTGFSYLKDVELNKKIDYIYIPVDPEAGYKVEGISLRRNKTSWELIKYGSASDINVKSGQTHEVNITLQRPKVELVFPSKVKTGERFEVSFKGDSPAFKSSRSIIIRNSPLTDSDYVPPTENFYNSDGGFVNAPADVGDGKMYLYTQIFIDERFMDDTGSITYLSPSVDLGEAPVTADLVSPATGINIGITY